MIVSALLGGLEFAARMVFESNSVLNINVGGMKMHHPTRRTQLIPNYQSNHITINSHGVQGAEFSIEPDLKGLRVLIIGDSVTFSPPERNYPVVIGEQLGAMFPDNSIEVISGAVPGYSSYDALDWYEEFLNELDPDIAIIHLGWNDMGQYHPFGLRYKNESLAYQEKSLIGSLMQNIYFLRVPYFFLGRIEQAKPIDLSPLSPDDNKMIDKFEPSHFLTNLKTLVSKLRAQGSYVYLVNLAGLNTFDPTESEIARMHFSRGLDKKLSRSKAVYDKYEAALELAAEEANTPTIDLRTLIDTVEKRAIFTDTMHINVEGSEIYGEYIAEEIREKVAELLATKQM